tara:strand:- start:42 stop:260 length:219 start_codon:yes stop_codon:yes gene_type:complete
MAFPTNPIYKFLKERTSGKDPDGNVVEPKTIAIAKYLGKEGHYLEIPISEDNTHYQEYLAWVAEGNTAEAAD